MATLSIGLTSKDASRRATGFYTESSPSLLLASMAELRISRLAPSFPGSAMERTFFEAPPRDAPRGCFRAGGACKKWCHQAEPGNKAHLSHPRSLAPPWNAPSSRLRLAVRSRSSSETGGACKKGVTRRSPVTRAHPRPSFPGSALERTFFEAPPRDALAVG